MELLCLEMGMGYTHLWKKKKKLIKKMAPLILE
jgi:hypothetical protein